MLSAALSRASRHRLLTTSARSATLEVSSRRGNCHVRCAAARAATAASSASANSFAALHRSRTIIGLCHPQRPAVRFSSSSSSSSTAAAAKRPSQAYNELVSKGTLRRDPQQMQVLRPLDALHAKLVGYEAETIGAGAGSTSSTDGSATAESSSGGGGWFSGLFGSSAAQSQPQTTTTAAPAATSNTATEQPKGVCVLRVRSVVRSFVRSVVRSLLGLLERSPYIYR